jgi:hypothetical protein
LETRLYKPYGQEYQSSGSSGYLPYRFNDRRDETNGTLRFPLRNLSDKNYHWTALDPIIRTNPSASVKNIGNPFSYAGYDPVNNIDLMGAANIPIIRPIPLPGEGEGEGNENKNEKDEIVVPEGQTITIIGTKTSYDSLAPSFDEIIMSVSEGNEAGNLELKEKVRLGEDKDGPLVAYEDVNDIAGKPNYFEIIAVGIPQQAKVIAPYLGKRFCVRIPSGEGGGVREAVMPFGFTMGKGKNVVVFIARIGSQEYIIQKHLRLVRRIVVMNVSSTNWVRTTRSQQYGNEESREALDGLPGKRCFGNFVVGK